MALQLGALRDALIDAGAKPEKADRAAEELAGYDREFVGIRNEIAQGFVKVDLEFADVRQEFRGEFAAVRTEMAREFAKFRGEMGLGFAKVDQEFTKVKGDMNLLRWVVGANTALMIAVFVKLFVH